MLERKFHQPEAGLLLMESDSGGLVISGYASLFGVTDQGGDVVAPGAYATSLAARGRTGGRIRMLWQHDPGEVIGIWEEVHEDSRGLWVQGRLLTGIGRGREAAELLREGAIDGLSIGYRTVRSTRDEAGRRVLKELDLWEVSLVTFPMLPEARVAAKSDELSLAFHDLAQLFDEARGTLERR